MLMDSHFPMRILLLLSKHQSNRLLESEGNWQLSFLLRHDKKALPQLLRVNPHSSVEDLNRDMQLLCNATQQSLSRGTNVTHKWYLRGTQLNKKEWERKTKPQTFGKEKLKVL